MEASAKSNRSSAKKRWEKERPLLEALIGFQFLFWQASKILRLRYSIHRMNKYGDKGSPCLIPLVFKYIALVFVAHLQSSGSQKWFPN
jgi:hypothetical protein